MKIFLIVINTSIFVNIFTYKSVMGISCHYTAKGYPIMYIYTVVPGDTLAGISTRLGLPQSVIAYANGLREPYSLTPGQALLILNGARTYTVQPGDSIYTIAARFGISANMLWRMNPSLAGGSTIYPGQTLVIYLPPNENPPLIATGYAYPFINTAVLRTTLPYLDYLAIFSYGFRADGSLVTADDDELLRIATEYGVKPMFVLTSLGDDGTFSSEAVSEMLTSPTVQETLINNIVETASRKGYASVNSDLEYIPPEDREEYNTFIRNLADALHAVGIELTVSLAPKTSDEQAGLLYEAIDYAALGAAADRVLLMTYEWGYTYSEPRAVAPINNVAAVVDYALTVIPREKIDLGMPNYGYDWQLPWVEGTPARAIGNIAAQELAIERGVMIMYDETDETPYFNYTAEDSSQRVVWFEDARSVASKLELARSRELGGIGIWQIMRWFPQLWLQT